MKTQKTSEVESETKNGEATIEFEKVKDWSRKWHFSNCYLVGWTKRGGYFWGKIQTPGFEEDHKN